MLLAVAKTVKFKRGKWRQPQPARRGGDPCPARPAWARRFCSEMPRRRGIGPPPVALPNFARRATRRATTPGYGRLACPKPSR